MKVQITMHVDVTVEVNDVEEIPLVKSNLFDIIDEAVMNGMVTGDLETTLDNITRTIADVQIVSV